MFRRTLTPFCPSAALAEIGAYVARDAALTPVVAIRGADGVARAFRNACRHRGVQLVDGAGCRKALTCRYHGWTYGLDGRLLVTTGRPEQRIPDIAKRIEAASVHVSEDFTPFGMRRDEAVREALATLVE